MKGGEGMALYDITALQTIEYDTANSLTQKVLWIDDTHVILYYVSTSYVNKLQTYSVSPTTGFSLIDSLDIQTATSVVSTGPSLFGDMIELATGYYAVEWKGISGDGYVATFSIDSNADNITKIDELEFDTSTASYASMCKIGEKRFCIAYGGVDTDGFLASFSVDVNYDNITVIDSIEHDIGVGRDNSIILMKANRLALAYASTSNIGYLKTFSFDANYDNLTEIDSLLHNNDTTLSSSLVRIDDTHGMLGYWGDVVTDGYLTTFSVDANHDNITEIETLEYATTDGWNQSLVKITDTHYVIGDTGANSDGFIRVISIDGSYQNITVVSSLEYDTSDSLYNNIAFNKGYVVVAYQGTSVDGFMKLLSIDGTGSTDVTITGVIGEATASADAHTITTTATATIAGVIGEAVASADTHTIIAVTNITITGVIGEAVAGADVHSVSTVMNAVIVQVIGEAVASGDTHVISTVINLIISGVIGELTASSDTHTISVSSNVVIESTIGAAVAGSYTHIVTAVGNQTLSINIGEAVASADTHTIVAGVGLTISPDIGSATASADTHLVYDVQLIEVQIGEAVAGADAPDIGLVFHLTIVITEGDLEASAGEHILYIVNAQIGFDVILSATDYPIELSLIEHIIELSQNDFGSVSMEVIGMAIEGSTVRLQAIFYDITGVVVDCDADAVKFRIYDLGRGEVQEYDALKGTTGTYYYDYTIPHPNSTRVRYYEFAGKIATKDVVGRAELLAEWK